MVSNCAFIRYSGYEVALMVVCGSKQQVQGTDGELPLELELDATTTPFFWNVANREGEPVHGIVSDRVGYWAGTTRCKEF